MRRIPVGVITVGVLEFLVSSRRPLGARQHFDVFALDLLFLAADEILAIAVPAIDDFWKRLIGGIIAVVDEDGEFFLHESEHVELLLRNRIFHWLNEARLKCLASR